MNTGSYFFYQNDLKFKVKQYYLIKTKPKNVFLPVENTS